MTLLSGVAALAAASAGAQISTDIGVTTSPGGISAICDLLAIDNAADCALITKVESRGDASWYVDDNRLLRSGDIDHGESSCLHIFATLPDAMRIGFRMSASSQYAPSLGLCLDALKFKDSDISFVQSQACGVAGFSSSPLDVRFRRMDTYVTGEVEWSWCYEKNASGNDGADAGWLHELYFIRSGDVEDVAGVVDAVTDADEISNICKFATGTNAADCALIGKIESKGDASWHVSDDLRLRSGDVTHDQSSCLHIAATLPNARRLDIRMGASSEADSYDCYDHLNFKLPPSVGTPQARACGPSASGVTHDINFHKELSAGAVEFSLCYEKDASVDEGEDAGWLRRLRFIEPRPAMELTLPEWIQGEVADIGVSMRMRDNYGNAFYKDADAALVAELEGGAVFVDAAGIVTDTVSIAQGVELRRSLSVRLDAATATLKIALQSGGVSTNLEATLLTASNPRQKQETCSALDVSDADCARLTGFVTAGGSGRVMAGMNRGDATFAWSVVSITTATGGSALRSARLGDGRHSCLGFDVHLDSPEYLVFDWRVSSQSSDTLSLWVDGQSDDMDAISGDVGEWRRHLRELEAGDRRIRWCYEKNAADSAGDDAAWLDNMRLEPSRPQLKLSVNSSSTLGASTDLFPQVTMNLGLRLADQFGRILPLSLLFESGSFQPKVIVGEGVREVSRLEPVDLVQIADDATLYEWDASFFLPWASEGDLALVVEAAVSAGMTLVSNPVPLPSNSIAEKVCAAASISEADCALIATISASGDRPWYIEEIDGVSALRSGDIDDEQSSCLHMSPKFSELRALDFRVGISSQAIFDRLIFRLNNPREPAVRETQRGREQSSVDGERGVFLWQSGVDAANPDPHTEAGSRSFLERVAGSHDFSWCYEKDFSASVGKDVAVLVNLRFSEALKLKLMAPSAVALSPGESEEVAVSMRLRSDAGEVWSRATAADVTLIASLDGAALFVDGDGDAGRSMTRVLSLNQGVGVTALFVRPTSDAGATLRLALSVDGLSVTATVSLAADVPVAFAGLSISAPSEEVQAAAREAFSVALTLGALDNYGEVWTQDVTATLTAELIGKAVFVGVADGATITTGTLSISAGQTTTSLHLRLTSAFDAWLPLTLTSADMVATATVSLRAADRALQRLDIAVPDEALVARVLEIREAPVSLRALDNYGDVWEVDAEAMLTAELSSAAVFVDDAGGALGASVDIAFSIVAGSSTPLLRMRPISGAPATLRLTVTAYGLTSSVAVRLLPANAIDAIAAVCQDLDLSETNCTRFIYFSTSGGDGGMTEGIAGDNDALGWSSVEVADATGASALKSAELDDDEHSCLGFHVRLDRIEVLTFDWRVSSQSSDTLRLWIDGETRAEDAIQGEVNEWRMHMRELAAGERQIRWCYEKDAAGSAGADAAWLDNVRMEAARPMALTLTRADVSSSSLAFEALTTTLELRLFDQFGRALPLADLTAAAFPLQIRPSVAKGLPLIWSPSHVEFSSIAADALSHAIDLSVESLTTNDGEPLRIFVETAATAPMALASNVVSLPLGDFQQYRQVFCGAVGLDDAACALVADIYASGSSAWRLQDGAGLVSGRVGDSEDSCLHVRLNFDEPRTLETRMRVSSEAQRDLLVFRLNDSTPRPDRAFRADDFLATGNDVDGRPTVFLGRSGDQNFMHRQRLPTGESEVSWCYQKDLSERRMNDAGYLRELRFLKLKLALEAPEELTLAGAPVNMNAFARAFDDHGGDWHADISAELGAELQADAMFVSDDGDDMGAIISRVILIASGVETTASLRLRLTSDSDAKLLLRLSADGALTTATVSLHAADRALQRLHIQAPSEVSAAKPFEIFDVPVSLGAFDNYDDAWFKDVTATLTAELSGRSVFVEDGGDAGAMTDQMILIASSGQTTTSLHVRLMSSNDATLMLKLSLDNVIATATVSLRAAPGELRSLQIDAPQEVLQATSGEVVAVTFELSALDDYDEFITARVALAAQALDSHLAQVQLVGEALSSSGSFLIASGEATVVVEALPSPGRAFSLQLEARAGDISERAVTRIVAAVSADSRLLAEGPSQLVLDADGRGGFDFILRAVDAAGTSNVEVQGVRLGVAENARVSVSFDTTSTLDLTTEPLNIRVTVELAGLNDAELALLVTHDALIDGELLVRLLRGPETLDVTQDQKLDTEDLIVIARYLQDASLDADHLLRNLKMPSADAAVVIEALNRLRMDMALDLDGDGDGDGVDVRLLLRYGLGLDEALLPADFDEAKARALLSGQ